ncbi:hypothetical protein Droror1_Dr00002863 [Drosera rotundifolia]
MVRKSKKAVEKKAVEDKEGKPKTATKSKAKSDGQIEGKPKLVNACKGVEMEASLGLMDRVLNAGVKDDRKQRLSWTDVVERDSASKENFYQESATKGEKEDRFANMDDLKWVRSNSWFLSSKPLILKEWSENVPFSVVKAFVDRNWKTGKLERDSIPKKVNKEFHFWEAVGNIVKQKVDYEWLHVPKVTESKALPSEVKQLDILQIKIAKQLDEKGVLRTSSFQVSATLR